MPRAVQIEDAAIAPVDSTITTEAAPGAVIGFVGRSANGGQTRTRDGKTFYPFPVCYLGDPTADQLADRFLLIETVTVVPYGVITEVPVPVAP